jgi:hypothetical protein
MHFCSIFGCAIVIAFHRVIALTHADAVPVIPSAWAQRGIGYKNRACVLGVGEKAFAECCTILPTGKLEWAWKQDLGVKIDLIQPSSVFP